MTDSLRNQLRTSFSHSVFFFVWVAFLFFFFLFFCFFVFLFARLFFGFVSFSIEAMMDNQIIEKLLYFFINVEIKERKEE